MGEVSDSIHLRRFCRLGLIVRVPDESTVRKLTRRLGAEVVHQLTRELIQKGRREKRFRPRAARIDSTVVEADVRYLTDSGAGLRRRAGAGPRGSQARCDGQGQAHRGPRSLAGGRPPGAWDHALNPPALRGGQGRGAQADRADRHAAGHVGQGSSAAGGRGQASGAGSWRAAKAQGRPGARAARRPLREGHRADPQADQGREDHRPVWCRCGIPTPGRSARASSASPISSGMSISCARSPPTPSRGREGSSSRRSARSATRPRTRCCPAPQPS
jgi:hypothetical protein